MNSKGHLYTSLAKSFIRIGSCALAVTYNKWEFFAAGFILAEGLGILEELVDKR